MQDHVYWQKDDHDPDLWWKWSRKKGWQRWKDPATCLEISRKPYFFVGSLFLKHYINLKPQTLNTKPLIPRPLKPETLNPKVTADGSSRKGWLTKAGVLIHKWSRGEDISEILARLGEHPSMVPFLRKLDREYAREGERCYRQWL